MHIVFVCAEYPVDGRPAGGFGTYVKNISAALVALGHQVTVVTRFAESKIKVVSGLTILTLASFDGLKFLNNSSPILFKRIAAFLDYPLLFSWQVKNSLKQLIDLERVDIIEGSEFAAELFFYLLLKNKPVPPVVIKLHTPSFIIRKFNKEKRNLFFRVVEFCEKFVLTKVDFVYSPTKNLINSVTEEYGVRAAKIIPYPALSSKKVKVKRRNDIIIYVGKMQTKKGVFVLATAIPKILKIHPKTKFIFIGPDTIEDGKSVKEKLRSQLFSLINSVRFVGEIQQTKLSRYYAKATMIVAPSLWENLPNVLIEASVLKCPIVTTNVGGMTELITHKKQGILVSPGDAVGLSIAISQLLKNKALRSRLAKNAYVHISTQLKPERVAKETIKFYEDVIKEKAKV